MESLKEEPAYLESLSRAAQELEAVLLETQETKQPSKVCGWVHIRSWKKRSRASQKRSELKKRMSGMQNEIAQQTGNQERIRTELQSKTQH